MIELTFLKKLMLIRQGNQKSAIFVLEKAFKFQSYACSRCHDLVMVSMDLSDIAILNIKRIDYRCIISRISKSEAIITYKHG